MQNQVTEAIKNVMSQYVVPIVTLCKQHPDATIEQLEDHIFKTLELPKPSTTLSTTALSGSAMPMGLSQYGIQQVAPTGTGTGTKKRTNKNPEVFKSSTHKGPGFCDYKASRGSISGFVCNDVNEANSSRCKACNKKKTETAKVENNQVMGIARPINGLTMPANINLNTQLNGGLQPNLQFGNQPGLNFQPNFNLQQGLNLQPNFNLQQQTQPGLNLQPNFNLQQGLNLQPNFNLQPPPQQGLNLMVTQPDLVVQPILQTVSQLTNAPTQYSQQIVEVAQKKIEVFKVSNIESISIYVASDEEYRSLAFIQDETYGTVCIGKFDFKVEKAEAKAPEDWLNRLLEIQADSDDAKYIKSYDLNYAFKSEGTPIKF